MSEKIIVICSLCNAEIETTHDEYTRRGDKCWKCSHGDLNIIWGEYSEIALDVYRLLKALKKLPPNEAARIAKPITDYIKPPGQPQKVQADT